MKLLKDLTIREKQVAQLIANGYTSLGIAEKLKLTKHTIETHRKFLMRKVKAKNVAHLVMMMVNKNSPIYALKDLFEKERKELNNLKRENKRLSKRNWQLEVRLAKR